MSPTSETTTMHLPYARVEASFPTSLPHPYQSLNNVFKLKNVYVCVCILSKLT